MFVFATSLVPITRYQKVQHRVPQYPAAQTHFPLYQLQLILKFLDDDVFDSQLHETICLELFEVALLLVKFTHQVPFLSEKRQLNVLNCCLMPLAQSLNHLLLIGCLAVQSLYLQDQFVVI